MGRKGGYQNLIVYQQAVLIYDLNFEFCQKYLGEIGNQRTKDQMEQAGRSGKQNIVEGSLEKSLKMNIKLTGVARGSFGELLEDYKDFLRTRKLEIWDKNDSRLLSIRKMRINANESNTTYWTNWTNSPEAFANLMLTLLSKENFLLDRMVASLENKFVQEGGYSENLTRKRLDFKRNKLD